MTGQQQDRNLDSADAWRRARRSLRRLFHDLADLQEAGGAASAAESEYWPERRVSRAAGELNLVRRMLRNEVARLRAESAGHDVGPGWSWA